MAARDRFTNNGVTTLDGAIADSDLSLVVISAANFPTSGRFRILIDSEIILVDAPSGTTFGTLTRGAEGSVAAAHSNGATIRLILTAGLMDLVRPLWVLKTADESVVDNTLQDDDELKWTIAANEKWAFEMELFITNAAATGDIKITWTLPVSCTITYGMHGAIVAVGATGDSDIRIAARHRDTTGAGAINMGIRNGAPTIIRVVGVVINGANAGTVQLQWAQDTTDAGNATVVKADSFIHAHLLPY